MKRARVTMQQIADEAGITRAAVSLALQAHPSIPESTRTRIQEIATRLGYRPNPLISALMADLRMGKPGQRASTIAYVSHLSWERLQGLSAARRYFAGASQRAAEFGFKLDFFQMDTTSEGNTLSKMFFARGIRGVLFAPGPPGFSLKFLWPHFCPATLGYTLKHPGLNRAVNHQYHTVCLAFRKAQEAGHRRIALWTTKVDEARTEHLWVAGYLACQQDLTATERLPVFYMDGKSHEQMRAWLDRHKPDVLLTPKDIAMWVEFLESQNRSYSEISLILLDRSDEEKRAPGVDQRPNLTGTVGIDIVIQGLMTNSYGLPQEQRTIMTEGIWVDEVKVPIEIRSRKMENASSKPAAKKTRKPAPH